MICHGANCHRHCGSIQHGVDHSCSIQETVVSFKAPGDKLHLVSRSTTFGDQEGTQHQFSYLYQGWSEQLLLFNIGFLGNSQYGIQHHSQSHVNQLAHDEFTKGTFSQTVQLGAIQHQLSRV